MRAGIFLGEITAPLRMVGDGFVQLLQMAVLPYIIITLISGLGKLKYQEAVALSLRVGSLLLLIWALTLAVVYVLPLSFPSFTSAPRFSATHCSSQRRRSIFSSSFPKIRFIRWPTISCRQWCCSALRWAWR